VEHGVFAVIVAWAFAIFVVGVDWGECVSGLPAGAGVMAAARPNCGEQHGHARDEAEGGDGASREVIVRNQRCAQEERDNHDYGDIHSGTHRYRNLVCLNCPIAIVIFYTVTLASCAADHDGTRSEMCSFE
jgi:hypothetical protein